MCIAGCGQLTSELLDLVVAKIAECVKTGVLVEIVQRRVVVHRGDKLVDGLFIFHDGHAEMNHFTGQAPHDVCPQITPSARETVIFTTPDLAPMMRPFCVGMVR